MSERCPYCGTDIEETNYGRLFCPNHGIIEKSEDSSDDESTPSYIG